MLLGAWLETCKLFASPAGGVTFGHVCNTHRQSPGDVAKSATIARHMIREEGADVLGLVVNRVRQLSAVTPGPATGEFGP